LSSKLVLQDSKRHWSTNAW